MEESQKLSKEWEEEERRGGGEARDGTGEIGEGGVEVDVAKVPGAGAVDDLVLLPSPALTAAQLHVLRRGCIETARVPNHAHRFVSRPGLDGQDAKLPATRVLLRTSESLTLSHLGAVADIGGGGSGALAGGDGFGPVLKGARRGGMKTYIRHWLGGCLFCLCRRLSAPVSSF